MSVMTEKKTEAFEGVDPSNVHVGDRLQFMTRETGFNGAGPYSRTGTVTKVTAKTVQVDCGRGWGTAVLRRDVVEWHSRDVRRVVTGQPARRPYNAENVQIVDDGGPVVTAVWVSDPTVDPAVALENILCRDLPYEVEVIAEATRFYKQDGADFSGWIVSAGANWGDSLPNKREAMKELRWAIRDRFQR